MTTEAVSKWRIWCNTEQQWIETWGQNPPTTCPHNITHELDITKTTIVEMVKPEFPISEVGGKVWVHNSSKPVFPDKMLYVQWIGRGDDVINHVIGGHENDNDILHLHCVPGTYVTKKDVKFDPLFGYVYIHEGYLSWHNAGDGDHVSSFIVAEPSLLQPFVNLDLIVDEDGFVKLSPMGPGTGTHGFAAVPNLLVRSFSKDGDWDYSETSGLTPNMSGTGEYKISVYEQIVHAFMRDIPVYGTNPLLFRMVCEETFRLPSGYFLRVEAHNKSDTTWHATVLVTVYRERTYQP